MLECAEGTLGQMRQFYGDRIDQVLRRIHFVYISHMHADHLGGLYGLVRQRRRAFENLNQQYEKLTVFCPNKYLDVGRKQWEFFREKYSFDDDIQVVFNRKLNNGLSSHHKTLQTNYEKNIFAKLQEIGISEFQTVLVEHIYDAHALVLKHQDNWSIAFSGDCKQSNNFIQAGLNLLVKSMKIVSRFLFRSKCGCSYSRSNL